MKRIWNTFCEDISKNKGVKEMTFEKEIVKGFLQALGWSRYDRNLEEQFGLYSRKWIPDFVFYLNNDKNAKEIILELKKPDHKQRKVDIEQNFDEATPAEGPAPQKKTKPKKQENPKAKTDRRPPFKFSMIGLKPGDTIVFAPNGEEVRVNSENTIDYDGQIHTLSRFCKIYMPDEDSENKEYQGPAHFTYNGKTLDEIRKEKEK